MKKRIMCFLMCILLTATSVLPGYAKENDVRDQLNERQAYVYDLVQAVSNNKYSMLKVCQAKDNYFQIMDTSGIIDILSFGHTIEALMGGDRFQQSYLDTVISEIITVRDVDYKQENLDKLDKATEVIKKGNEILGDDPGYFDKIASFVKTTKIASEGQFYLYRVAHSLDLYLNALSLVAKHSKDENISFTAKKAYVTSKSKDAKAQAMVWAEKTAEKTADELVSDLTSGTPLVILKFAKLGYKLVKKEDADKNLKELHATSFQSAVGHAFFDKLFSKGGNYLQNDYSDEELADLHSLACLYLKAGMVGFSYNKWSNKKKCKKELKRILNLSFPESSETYEGPEIVLNDYSVPGQLSEGDKYCFFGTVKSSEPLNKVTVKIVSDQNSYQYDSPNLNSNSYNIKNLDNDITVNKMPVNDYHYIVTATTGSGTYVVLDEVFKIVAEDGNMTINQYRIPGVLKKGQAFVVKGLVKSNSPLSKVKVEIIKPDGTWVTGDENTSVSSNQYDLAGLDANTRFDLLSPGKYRYRIMGTNNNGTEVLVDQPIMVEE